MKLSRYTNSIIIVTIFIVFINSGTRTLQSAEAQRQLINEMPPHPGSKYTPFKLYGFDLTYFFVI
jgi:hypothetical protein